MPAIWTRSTRERQPEGLAAINWRNPIAPKLRALFDLRTGQELVSGKFPTTVTSAPERNGDRYRGRQFTVAGSSELRYAHTPELAIVSDISIVALLDIGTLAGYSAVIAKQQSSTNFSPYEFRIGYGATDTQLFFLRARGSGAYRLDQGNGGSLISGNTNNVMVGLTSGASLTDSGKSVFYVNGMRYGSTALAATSGEPIDDGSSPVIVGSRTDGVTRLNATLHFIALFGEKLSPGEMVSLHQQRFQLFGPARQPVFYSLGGGAAALAGAATSGASATGALSTAIPILGAAVSGATASGSLSTAISLAGATATISGTAAGDLSATIRLAGDAVSGAIAAGGLATGIPLVGDGTGGAAGAGDLSTGSGLAGAGAAGAAGTGVLTTQITLSGAAIAQAIASGALTTTPAGLAGDGTSSSSGSGALSTGIPLAGAAAVSVVGTGGLVTAIPLAGAAIVAVSATGDLVVSLGLAGAALISAIGSGALLASITLSGAAVAGAVGAGALSGAALHASPWRTVTSLARVRSVRATARVRRCIAGVR